MKSITSTEFTQQLYHASNYHYLSPFTHEGMKVNEVQQLDQGHKKGQVKAEAGIQVRLMAKASSQSPSAALSWIMCSLKQSSH